MSNLAKFAESSTALLWILLYATQSPVETEKLISLRMEGF